MFRQHVSSHLTNSDLLELHLFQLEHPVPHEVVLGQNLFGASMVHWVVDNVESRLVVHRHSNWVGNSRPPHHLMLELSREVCLLGSRGELYVLALA